MQQRYRDIEIEKSLLARQEREIRDKVNVLRQTQAVLEPDIIKELITAEMHRLRGLYAAEVIDLPSGATLFLRYFNGNFGFIVMDSLYIRGTAINVPYAKLESVIGTEKWTRYRATFDAMLDAFTLSLTNESTDKTVLSVLAHEEPWLFDKYGIGTFGLANILFDRFKETVRDNTRR